MTFYWIEIGFTVSIKYVGNLHLNYCYTLCLLNESMCLFVMRNHFICESILYLFLSILAYVDMQRHSKNNLCLVVQTLFIQRPNQNLKRSSHCLLLQPYALAFVNNCSGTRYEATVRSYALKLLMHNKYPKTRLKQQRSYTLVVLYITTTQRQVVKQQRSCTWMCYI